MHRERGVTAGRTTFINGLWSFICLRESNHQANPAIQGRPSGVRRVLVADMITMSVVSPESRDLQGRQTARGSATRIVQAASPLQPQLTTRAVWLCAHRGGATTLAHHTARTHVHEQASSPSNGLRCVALCTEATGGRWRLGHIHEPALPALVTAAPHHRPFSRLTTRQGNTSAGQPRSLCPHGALHTCGTMVCHRCGGRVVSAKARLADVGRRSAATLDAVADAFPSCVSCSPLVSGAHNLHTRVDGSRYPWSA